MSCILNAFTNKPLSFILIFCIGLFVEFEATAQTQDKVNTDSLLSIYTDSSKDMDTRIQALDQTVRVMPYQNPDTAIVLADVLYEWAVANHDTDQVCTALEKKGFAMLSLGDMASSKEVYVELIDIYQTAGDRRGMATSIMNLGIVNYSTGNVSEGVENFITATAELEQVEGGKQFLQNAYTNLAAMLTDIKDYKRAEVYLRKSLKVDPSDANDPTRLGLIVLLETTKRLDEAQKVLESIDPKGALSTIPVQLGRYYLILGSILQKQNEHEKATSNYLKAIEILSPLHANYHLVEAQLSLGELLNEQGKYQEAESWCLKGYALSNESQIHNDLMLTCRCLSNAYKGLEEFEKALRYYQEEVMLHDSLFSTESVSDLAHAEANFVAEKNRLQDSLATASIIAEEKAENARLTTRNHWVIGTSLISLIVLCGFLWFAFSHYKIIKGQNTVISKQQDLLQRDYSHLKEFTENASHEIQTPMAIIQSKVDNMMQAPELSEQLLHQIQSVSDAAFRLSVLNRSLLLLAKIENNQFPADQKINFSQLLRKQINGFAELYEDGNIELKCEIEANVEVIGHPYLIDIIISNLLKNSIRHNVSENGSAVVTLSKKSFWVENTGPVLDIDPNTLFERFKKQGSSAESSGLGLAIVQKACAFSNWKVSYQHVSGLHALQVNFNQG